MSRRGWWVTAVVCAGCTQEVVVTPVIDLPVDDPEAAPFATLDEITLAVAHAGEERDRTIARFTRGETFELGGVPFGDDLVIHMTGFDELSPSAYGRTCTFALDADGPSAQPHLFFSRSLRFASTGIESIARIGGRAVSLDGAAILIGGTVRNNPVLDIERFDPLTGELSTVGVVTERVGAVDALLGTSSARVIIVGGRIGAQGAGFVETIDPEDEGNPVNKVENTKVARVGLTATTLTDGRVIGVGGNPPGLPPVGTITQISAQGADVDIVDLRTELAHPRTAHTATRLGDDIGAPVLIAGGVDATGSPVAVAELFKPLTDELARPATFAPQMVVPRSGHAAVRMPDGSVLFIGGVDAADNEVRTLEQFTREGDFVVVGELPDNAAVLDSTVTTLPDGRILIAGGRKPGGPPTDTAFIAVLREDGSIDVVQTLDRLAAPRAGHQATLLCDGTVLISGGTEGAAPMERYNPPVAGRR